MLVTSTKIEATQSFINLKDSVQKKLILKPSSVKDIQHGVNLSNNLGFERYLEISHPSQRTKEIVKELINFNDMNVVDPETVN